MASATALGLVLFLTLAPAATAADIVIQPKAISLDSKGGTVSVHTDIDYSEGAPWTAATLNGLQAYLVKSDLCGNLVAKFDLDAVKAMVPEGAKQLTLPFEAIGAVTTHTGTDTVTITSKK